MPHCKLFEKWLISQKSCYSKKSVFRFHKILYLFSIISNFKLNTGTKIEDIDVYITFFSSIIKKKKTTQLLLLLSELVWSVHHCLTYIRTIFRDVNKCNTVQWGELSVDALIDIFLLYLIKFSLLKWNF